MGTAGVVTPESRDSYEHLSQLHHIKTKHQRCACWGLEEERGTTVWREGTPGRYLFSPAFPSHPHRPYVSSCTTSHRLPLPRFPYSTPPTSPRNGHSCPSTHQCTCHTRVHTVPMRTHQVVRRRKPPGPGVGRGERGHRELSPGGSPYSCNVGPGRSLKMRGAHRRRETKAFEAEGEAGRDAQERVLRKRPQR